MLTGGSRVWRVVMAVEQSRLVCKPSSVFQTSLRLLQSRSIWSSHKLVMAPRGDTLFSVESSDAWPNRAISKATPNPVARSPCEDKKRVRFHSCCCKWTLQIRLRWFKWLWPWCSCWCQTGCFEYHRIVWSIRISLNKSLYREQSKQNLNKTSRNQQLSVWKCLVDARGQNRNT